ncbi:MAG: CDP-glycerol glycerophosphotransferase family protein [Methanobacteriaceae archaeon]|nr:CDP-glycerol glycerophosphotransferase family protein [Methanobacteriaceae archaeon]
MIIKKIVDFLENSETGMKFLSFLRSIVKLINFLIPKKNNQIMFESIPDFSDNSKALYDYMRCIGRKYEMIWAVNEINDKFDIPQYKKLSLRQIWEFLRSKYIITASGYHLPIKAKNQVFVNVWHGMPLKAMFYAETFERDFNLPYNYDDENYYLIATSTVMRNALAACFNQDPRRIYVTGQPRNDKLFKGCDKKIFKILDIDPRAYEKIVLFAPTFRKLEYDGRIISYKFNLPDFNRERFQDFLEEHNILLLVKFHPVEEKEATKYFKDLRNVKLIKTETLQENLIDLYNILPCIDILITDYSSIYFDFLLLDRPIIFITTDLKEYKKKRGFILEPFEFWTPGPKVKNFDKLLKELEKTIKNPNYYQEERKLINDLVNYYKDNKSAERVYKLVFED